MMNDDDDDYEGDNIAQGREGKGNEEKRRKRQAKY